jgi:hypothetical protein
MNIPLHTMKSKGSGAPLALQLGTRWYVWSEPRSGSCICGEILVGAKQIGDLVCLRAGREIEDRKSLYPNQK